MGAYDGEISRGIRTNESSLFWKYATLDAGSTVQMRSISSWSSNEEVAKGFADDDSAYNYSVILKVENNKSAVGVQHISKWAKAESEVLAPSTAKWKVKSKTVMTKADYIRQKGGTLNSWNLDDAENHSIAIITLTEQ